MKSTALAEAHQKFYSVAPLLLHASTLIASSWKLGDVLLDVLRALGTVVVSNGIVTVTLINGEVWDFTVPMKK